MNEHFETKNKFTLYWTISKDEIGKYFSSIQKTLFLISQFLLSEYFQIEEYYSQEDIYSYHFTVAAR